MKRHRMLPCPIAYNGVSFLTVRAEEVLLDVTRINGNPNREEFLRHISTSNAEELV